MKHIRKSLAVLLSVLMLVSLFAVSATMSVSAVADETILFACSDFQPSGNSVGVANVAAIMAAMKADGISRTDGGFVVGDYSAEYESSSASANGLAAVKGQLSNLTDPDNIHFVRGNHEVVGVNGVTEDGNCDPAYGDYGLYIVKETEDKSQEWGSYNAAYVAELELYLQDKIEIGFSKPIFILNHFPLHWSNRVFADGNTKCGYKYFDVINAAAAQGLNIIFLFGHNHNHGYDDFLGGSSIFLKKGDTIQVCQGSSEVYKNETLNFTYMNAGYVGYYNGYENSVDAETDLTMSVFRIRGNEVIISRYSADGQHNLKSAGVGDSRYEDGKIRPSVNPTVYAGSYKIAADGTATAVDTIYEADDQSGVFGGVQTSTSEDAKGVAGLAFKFDVAVNGLKIKADCFTQADYNTGTVQALGDTTDYKLVSMGAIVTNVTALGTDGSAFYLDKVDDVRTIDIHAKYLCELDDTSAAFAVRIINIPEDKYDVALYARPYYVFDCNGTEITVYGDIVGATYNGKLSDNDGAMEW